MALTNDDLEQVRKMIEEAQLAEAQATGELPPAQAKLANHERILILPGAAESRYDYAFLLDDDATVYHRLRLPKTQLRQFLAGILRADLGIELHDARVELHGHFDVTARPGPRRKS